MSANTGFVSPSSLGKSKEVISALPEVSTIQKIPIIPTLLDVISRTTGMGLVCVARVTDEKWIACGVLDRIDFGLKPGSELKLETTICNEVRQHGELVVIDHVSEDENFRDHHIPVLYGFQSYISVPIFLQNNDFFGTLCAIDPRPAKLNNPETLGMFTLFAQLISFHINASGNVSAVEKNLLNEQRIAKLREQFIAILGHDLRSPLSAVLSSAQMVQRLSSDETVVKLGSLIHQSASRMNGLINNVMDFASGRLGGGLPLCRRENEPVEDMLNLVRSELKFVYTDRTVQLNLDLAEPVYCDGSRLAQVFSNLLANALKYGKQDGIIVVDAESREGRFNLSVSNEGRKIPDEIIEKLFEPFSRGNASAKQEGLGLGLYIASEIAYAHGGQLKVLSTDEKTCFTLTIPNGLTK
jgi:signal transduction histidine kinase